MFDSLLDLFSHLQVFKFSILDRDTVRLFHCKKLSYYWDESRKTFRKLDGLDRDVTTASLHQLTGLTTQEQFLR